MFYVRMISRLQIFNLVSMALLAASIWAWSANGVAAPQMSNESEALHSMGGRYEDGDGVPQDYAKAREYYEKAGEMGNARALSRLGTMYRTGLGVPKDLERAIGYYQRSVSLGFKWSQKFLDEALAEQGALAARDRQRQQANEARLAEQELWARTLSDAGPQTTGAASGSAARNSPTNLGGTLWTITEAPESCYEYSFRPDGRLLFIYPNQGQWKLDQGTWKQEGNTVYVEMFNGTRKQQGQLSANRMEGETKTRAGDTYAWMGELNPKAGSCNYRANYAFLREREALGASLGKASRKGWKATTSAAYDEGRVLVDRGEYSAGFKKMMTAAEAGDARAQYFIGLQFASGNASGYVEQSRAATWYRKAAVQGYADAENHLGTRYHNGAGVPQDYGLARSWYLFADADGSRDAAFNLGLLAENGLGMPADQGQALVWYRKAASLGHVGAAGKLETERQTQLAQQREVDRQARQEENRKRAAAGLQPSEDQVLRILVADLAKYTDRGDVEYPDNLVKTVPVLGEVRRTQVSIMDLDCGKPSKNGEVQCDFVSNRKIIGGLGGLTTQFANENGTNTSYSVRFQKSSEAWISPELDQKVIAMGRQEAAKREAERAAYRSWHEIGTTGTYCKDGNKTDLYGNVINYNDVNCY